MSKEINAQSSFLKVKISDKLGIPPKIATRTRSQDHTSHWALLYIASE